MRRSPVRMSASIRRTLSSVGMTSGSFWKPSRGPTSRMRTSVGSWVTGTLNIYSPPLTEPVAIIGASGALGFGLALRWGRAGVPVVLGSRDAGRAEEAAERARELVPGGDFTAPNAEAAAKAEVVVLCVPFRNQSETLTNLKETLREGQLVVDATVPLAAAVGGRATRLLGVWQGSAAQQAQEMVPDGVRVVSALHTVSAATLRDLEHALDEDVLVCGDQQGQGARHGADRPIDGLRRVDCGRLEMARIVEGLTPLLISINMRHKTHAGIKITGLPTCVMSSWPAEPAAPSSPAACSTWSATTSPWSPTPPTTSRSTARTSRPTPTCARSGWPAASTSAAGACDGDTFHVDGPLRELGVDVWFNLGDRDLAIGLRRAQRLAEGARSPRRIAELTRGARASRAGAADERRAGPHARARPRGWGTFQEFMIRERARRPVDGVELRRHRGGEPCPQPPRRSPPPTRS